jgi:hypothetical protein
MVGASLPEASAAHVVSFLPGVGALFSFPLKAQVSEAPIAKRPRGHEVTLLVAARVSRTI